MNKKLIRLTESDLHRIVKESVNKVLNEEEMTLSDRLSNLRNQSKTYRPHDSNPNKMEKVFNRGMGGLEFIQIIPEENVLHVNKLLAKRRDMERIKEAFPEYTIEIVRLS